MHDKIINLFDLEELFNHKLPIEIAGYYKSGARDEITLKKDREIFNSYELLPKLLRDVTKIDISKNLLGCNLKNPIILDLRNIFNLDDIKKFNIKYHGIGFKS